MQWGIARGMADTKNQTNFWEGFLIWAFICGIFVISITIAGLTSTTAQGRTGWSGQDSMYYGAGIGIILTLILAFILERKSR